MPEEEPILPMESLRTFRAALISLLGAALLRLSPIDGASMGAKRAAPGSGNPAALKPFFVLLLGGQFN